MHGALGLLNDYYYWYMHICTCCFHVHSARTLFGHTRSCFGVHDPSGIHGHSGVHGPSGVHGSLWTCTACMYLHELFPLVALVCLPLAFSSWLWSCLDRQTWWYLRMWLVMYLIKDWGVRPHDWLSFLFRIPAWSLGHVDSWAVTHIVWLEIEIMLMLMI